MYELKCKDNANICTHLESFMKMHEQLTGMNATFTDVDLVTIMLGSLPKSYWPLINTNTMSAAHAKSKLEPDQVIGTLSDEFIEDHQLKRSKDTLVAVKGCRKHQGHNNASNATKSDVECQNCGKGATLRQIVILRLKRSMTRGEVDQQMW
jgi:gag-polypeptide of LTR copia-type